MKRLTLLLVTILGASCATSTRLFPIDYEFVDKPYERRLEVRYHNASNRTVCLLPEFWPNQAGKINQASESVFLLIDGQRFSIEEFNTGYCPDCPLRVAPGESARASINYEDFGIPESLLTADKHLEFIPKAYICKE